MNVDNNKGPLYLSPVMYKQWLVETEEEDVCWWAEEMVYTLSPYSKTVTNLRTAIAIIDMARANERHRGIAFPLDCYGELELLLS